MRCGAEPSTVAAPLFYRLRSAQHRGVADRLPGSDKVWERRRQLRRTRPRSAGTVRCEAVAKPGSAIGADALDDTPTSLPTPPGPTVRHTPPLGTLAAATEGVGAFQAAQRAALKSCRSVTQHSLLLISSRFRVQMRSKELLPMPRPFNVPAGPAPRSPRRRARWAATRAAMTMANQAAAAVSWLACGSP